MKRWQAMIWYRTEAGLVDVHHDFEELYELHYIVERGPTWQAIDRIDVNYVGLSERLTIEEAAKL